MRFPHERLNEYHGKTEIYSVVSTTAYLLCGFSLLHDMHPLAAVHVLLQHPQLIWPAALQQNDYVNNTLLQNMLQDGAVVTTSMKLHLSCACPARVSKVSRHAKQSCFDDATSPKDGLPSANRMC